MYAIRSYYEYRITLETPGDNDEMIVEVEVNKTHFSGDLVHLEKLSRQITHDIRDEVLVKPMVKLVEPGALPRNEGKAVRVLDNRKNR